MGDSPKVPTGDAPARHNWRGLHLDSARTFWSVDVVLELLDIMARYRLNRLHWHLTDDAGWRFEVPGYPRLLSVGAQLPREPFAWYTNVNHTKREQALASAPQGSTKGWYSNEDIQHIVDHAKSLGIEIMPEVDLPGHMAAAIRAYPHLGDPALEHTPPEAWMHRNDLLWPSHDTWSFLHAVVETICNLFDFEYIHIGGDECNFDVWQADDTLMASFDGNPRKVQQQFTAFASDELRKHNRRPAVWDEAVESGLTGDELVFAWRYEVGVPTAQKSGNPWVFNDASYLYLNHLSGPEDREPAGMRDIITPRDVLEAPVPDSAMGVQAACWTEFITDREALHYHLFPRLLAVAELAWNGPGISWEQFKPLLSAEMEFLTTIGVHGRPIPADA